MTSLQKQSFHSIFDFNHSGAILKVRKPLFLLRCHAALQSSNA